MNMTDMARRAWDAPALTVLMFRETTAGTTSLADGQVPGFSDTTQLLSPPPPTCLKGGPHQDRFQLSCTS